MPFVRRDGDGKVIGEYARPQPGKATEWLDDDHADLQPTFEENRTAKIAAIDVQSDALLAPGFTYDSKQFSLSEKAQIKILNFRVGILAGDIVDPTDYSINVSALDETDYEILDETSAKAYCKAGLDRVRNVLTTGTELKQSCLDAADQTALDLVTDTRT